MSSKRYLRPGNPVAQGKQKGLTALEFSIAGAVLFMVIFMTLEVGRLMYTMIILDSYTRVAARLAAVCPVDAASQTAVKNSARFSPLPGFTNNNIQLRYLDGNLVELDPTDEDDFESKLSYNGFVEASISNYQHSMIIPGLNLLKMTMPAFTTIIPAESLGVMPKAAGGVTKC